MTKRAKKILGRLLQIVFIGLIFYYLGRQIYLNWGTVTEYQWHLNYYYLVLSLLSVICAFFVFSSVWRLIILSLNKKVSYGKSFKIAYLANLGRYIPGKVWQMFGMIYLAKKEGVTETEAVTSIGLSQLFAIPSGMLSGLIYLSLYPSIIGLYSDNLLLITGLVIGTISLVLLSLLVVFFPRPVESVLNRLFRFVKRNPIQL